MFLLNHKIDILVHDEKNSIAGYHSFSSFHKLARMPLHIIYSWRWKRREKSICLISQIGKNFHPNILAQEHLETNLTHCPKVFSNCSNKGGLKGITTPITTKKMRCTHKLKQSFSPKTKACFSGYFHYWPFSLRNFLKVSCIWQLSECVFPHWHFPWPARDFYKIQVQWLNGVVYPIA